MAQATIQPSSMPHFSSKGITLPQNNNYSKMAPQRNSKLNELFGDLGQARLMQFSHNKGSRMEGKSPDLPGYTHI